MLCLYEYIVLQRGPIRSIYNNSKKFLCFLTKKKVSLVEQEPVLYARSIEENVRYGLTDSECPTDKIRDAACSTNCNEFISRLHDGYHTMTGEKGLQLSG